MKPQVIIEKVHEAENINHPKNYQGVIQTARDYISAGSPKKFIASCVYDELEGSDRDIIISAIEKGCGLDHTLSSIYYYNFLKTYRKDNATKTLEPVPEV
jgi:hypothetical protein